MASLSPIASIVRRHDRDRYLTALFAPADRRDALMALYAFNYEIARTREVVTEPVLGRIRLEWWRETIEEIYVRGVPRSHEVVEPLATAVRRFGLSRAHFDRLIQAREFDLGGEPPASLAALEAYCEDTSARLVWLALETLGVRDPVTHEVGRRVGIAHALTGLIRAIPFHARAGRQYIPMDLASEAKLDLRSLFELSRSRALDEIAKRLAERAQHHLARARERRSVVPRSALPALLPSRLSAAYLRSLKRTGYDPFDRLHGAGPVQLMWHLGVGAVTRRY